MDRFGWQDFTEDESTDAIPGKYVLTVGTVDEEGCMTGDEFFTIIHRASPEYPIDGPLAEAKRERAMCLVNILNTAAYWIDGDYETRPGEAIVDVIALGHLTQKALDTLA